MNTGRFHGDVHVDLSAGAEAVCGLSVACAEANATKAALCDQGGSELALVASYARNDPMHYAP